MFYLSKIKRRKVKEKDAKKVGVEKDDEKDKQGKQVRQNQVMWVLVKRKSLVIRNQKKCQNKIYCSNYSVMISRSDVENFCQLLHL